MVNERHNGRIKRAMKVQGYSAMNLARIIGVSEKTVQRWMYEGRIPRGERARKIAAALDVPVSWLWPRLVADRGSWRLRDICEVFTPASSMPESLLAELLLTARNDLVICSDDPWFLGLMNTAPRGMLVEPLSPDLKVRVVLARDAKWLGVTAFGLADVAEVRVHPVLADLSIVRSDDMMVVVYTAMGLLAANSPAFLIARETNAGPFDAYVEGFENIWAESSAYRTVFHRSPGKYFT